MRSIAGLSRSRSRWLAALFGAFAVAASARPAHGQLELLVVRHVNFQGNHGVDPLTLAASIATTQSSLFVRNGLLRAITFGKLGEKRYFNQYEFTRDMYRLQVVFKRSGYPDVRVDTVVKRMAGAVDVIFKITEGQPNRLASLDVVGVDSVDTPSQMRQDLPIVAGDVASDYKLHETADTIAFRLWNHGYPSATVEVDETGGADKTNARLVAHTGLYSKFGPIRVTAPLGVDTSHVSALINARPGNEYRFNTILRSQRSLYTSDLYRVASVGVDTERYSPKDSVVPLAVSVVASLGHRAKASAGYGTDDCFRVGAEWAARNFPTPGLVFDVTGQLSKIGVGDPLGFGLRDNLCRTLLNDSIGSRVANYGINASVRRNAFVGPTNALVLSVFATQHSEFEVYLRREIGTSVSVTHLDASNVPITLTYRIADGTTTANAASFCAFFNTCQPALIAALQQRRVQGTLGLSALRQRVNNPLDPFRGSILSGSVTWSSQWLGSSSTQQFLRMVGDVSGFVPLARSVVLAGHLRGGIIIAPQISVSDNSIGNFVPPDQRFYAGGAYDVRGYDQNELGPLVYVVSADSLNAATGLPISSTAVHVAPIGGTRVGIGNLEVRVPTPFLGGRLRAAVFVDAGVLWNAGGPSPLRVTPGAGLRYTSPIGPIRIDGGYNTYPLQAGQLFKISTDGSLSQVQDGFIKPRTGSLTWHFSIGQAF